jgi:hypothetical protein
MLQFIKLFSFLLAFKQILLLFARAQLPYLILPIINYSVLLREKNLIRENFLIYNIIFQRKQFSTARDEFCLEELAKTACLEVHQNHYRGICIPTSVYPNQISALAPKLGHQQIYKISAVHCIHRLTGLYSEDIS